MKLRTGPLLAARRRVVLMGEGPDDRRTTRALLALGGPHDVVAEVETVEAAVREVLRDPTAPPHCLVLGDPDAAGRVLAALARPGGALPCPVVALVDTPGPPQLRELLRAGAHEVLDRARLDGERLRETIERACERWSIAHERAVDRPTRTDLAPPRWFIEHVPAAVAMFDRDMCYVAVSRRWANEFGIADIPLLGRSHYDVFPDLPERWREVHRRALAGEVVTAEDDRFERADGSVQWLRWEVRPWPGPDGIGGIVISCEDTTARRRTEETLRESAEWLRLALAAGEMGAWTWDPRTDEARWDEGLEALLGVHPGPGPVRGAAFFAHVHPDDVARVRADTERALREGGSYKHEFRLIRPDGRVVWLAGQAAVIRDAHGHNPRLTGVNFDVTARRHAEEQLRRNQETFSRLIEHNPFGIYVVDADLRIWQVSEGARRMFAGVDPPLGRDLADALRGAWSEAPVREAIARFRHTLATGEPHRSPGTIERRPGALESYDWRIERITLPDGRFGVVCYFYDLTDRQRLEAALRASEERMRFLLRLSDEVRAETDPQRIVAAAMEALRRHVGADRAAWAEVEADQDHFVFTGSSVADGVPPVAGRLPVSAFGPAALTRMRAGLPLVVDDVDRARVDGDPSAYAATGIAALIAVPLHKGGRFTAGIGLHAVRPRRWTDAEIELTHLVAERLWEAIERAHVSRTLAEAAEHFRCFVELNPQIPWTADPHGKILDISERWTALTGLSRERSLGDGWAVVAHPDDIPPLIAQWTDALRTGEPCDVEHRVRTPGGPYRWMRSRAFARRDAAGAIVRWYGTTEDIDDRKRTEEALRDSEWFYRQTIESIPGLVFTCAPDGSADFVSEQWAEFTGVPTSALLGDGWPVIVHPDDRARAQATWRATAEGGGTYDIEYRVHRADGAYRWFKVRCRAIRDAAANVVRWFGTALDIDDLKRAEGSLREADRRKDEFLATLAHELRNPLAPIRTGLQLLRRAPADGSTAERARDIMERQLGHMVRLVDDLLDVSRVSRGKVELRRERIDVAMILEHAVETSRPLIDAGRHALAVRAPDAPLWVFGDLTRLAQVLSNLLNNAAKFTAAGGAIELSAAAEGDQVVLRVRDDGAGIPAEMLPRVFDMFAQVDRTRDRAQGGLGIGLALARKLVEMHGGTTEADSPGLGFGSTFTVRLPRAPTGEAPHDRGDAPRHAMPRRILVVDDNVDGADSLALLLELGGHEVAAAHDGREALAVAAAFAPDVVLLDIGLPELDGYEVARRLRADPRTAGARLIALTGWGSDADKRRSHDAGFDAHLTKPVDAAALTAVLAAP